jgi:hypothetical protein
LPEKESRYELLGPVVREAPGPSTRKSRLNRRIEKWFAAAGVEAFDDYETLAAPLPGRLSRGLRFLADQYSVLEIIDKF